MSVATAPVLVAVDDPEPLRVVERELRNRYEPDYQVRCLRSVDAALACLDELAANGEQVALVLAGEVVSGVAGPTLLEQVRRTSPHAQRVLLVDWGRLGEASTGEVIFEAVSRGRMDHHAIRPDQPPDEQFRAAASEASLVSGEEVYVVGGANSAGQAVLHLARFARRVTLVVRAATLHAGMSHYLVRQIEATSWPRR